jgi:hypothetical protein
MNKKGIELSINFIVLLILAMAMFGGGLLFVSKFFSKATSIKGSLDTQTERQIEAMLDSGSAFVIPIHTKEGDRGEFVKYGIGLYNDGRSSSEQFSISVNFDSAFAKTTKLPLCSGGCPADAMPQIKPSNVQTIQILPDQKQTFLVLFEIPPRTQSGTYIYTVESMQGGVEYEPSLQLIVKVD